MIGRNALFMVSRLRSQLVAKIFGGAALTRPNDFDPRLPRRVYRGFDIPRPSIWYLPPTRRGMRMAFGEYYRICLLVRTTPPRSRLGCLYPRAGRTETGRQRS